MASYYPVYLDIKGRSCVIIGGGEVAERKVHGLLDCGAKVSLISPEVTSGIREMAQGGSLQLETREYRKGDLKGAFLAIAATDRREVNEAIAKEAALEKVVLNVVDNAPLCTFIAPSVVSRGDVTVAVSTGGASPALARKLRESLEASETMEYAHLTGILSSARKELKRQGLEVHPDRWQESIRYELVDLVKSGKSEQALEQLMSSLINGSRGTATPE